MRKRPARKSTGNVARAFLARMPSAYVFPIKPGEKAPPCFKDELNLATNDPTMVKRWAERWPGCNWGVALKKSHLIVMDVDDKSGKVGRETLDMLELNNGPLPGTFKVRTPSGGWHLYFTETNTVRHVMRVGAFGKDVDSTNYVLLAGCALDAGGEYKIIESAPIRSAPNWFAEYLGNKPDAPTVSQVPEIELDQDANIAWAVDYLKRDAPPAILGKNGEATLLQVAGVLKDRGISEREAVIRIADHYNSRCEPPWSIGDGPIADRLDVKVHNAYAYLKENAPGSATAQADFGNDMPTDAELRKLGAWWSEFEKDWHARRDFTTLHGRRFPVSRPAKPIKRTRKGKKP